MEALYKVTKWDDEESDITEIVPTRQTDKTVWFMIRGTERSERKISSYYQYFNKKEDAISLIKSRNEKRQKDKYDKCIKDSAHDLLDALIESRLYVEMAAKNCYNPVADNLLSKIDGLIAKARG